MLVLGTRTDQYIPYIAVCQAILEKIIGHLIFIKISCILLENILKIKHAMEREIIIQLAEEFGLPCIQRENMLTLVGEQSLIIFNNVEDTTCQLIEIY